jgi:eukaryotic-like serine/threonine-protein kinase
MKGFHSGNFKIFLILIFLFPKINSAQGTMFRGGITHRAKYGQLAITKPPSIKWKYKTEGAVISSPVLYDNRIICGSRDGFLHCLDVSGNLQWKFKTDGHVDSSPAISDGVVFFMSHDGNFYAVEAATGKLKWKFKTAGEKHFSAPGIHGRTPRETVFIDDWDFFLSSPAVNDGKVYFGTGSGYFYCLDELTGIEKWKFKTENIIHSSPAIAFGKVYFGSWDTNIYALDAESGEEIWKFKTGEDPEIYNQTGLQGSPLIAENNLYIGCRDSYMYALNAINGNLLWKKYNEGAWVSASPVFAGENLVYFTGDSHLMIGVNRNTGAEVFKTNMKDMIFSSPAVAGNVIYFGMLNGMLAACDGGNGKTLWIHRLESSITDPYKLQNADSTINYEVVFSAEKRTAEKKSSMDMIFSLGSVISSPIISGRTIYVGSTDGNIYSFE